MCTRSQISSQNMQGANTTTVHVSLVRVLERNSKKQGQLQRPSMLFFL